MCKSLTPMKRGKFAAIVIEGKHYIRRVQYNARDGLHVIVNNRVYFASQFTYI